MRSRIAGALAQAGKAAVRYGVGRARHGVANEIDRKVETLYKPYTRGGMMISVGVSAAVALLTVAFGAVAAGAVLLAIQTADEPLLVGGLILLIGGAILGVIVIIAMIVGILVSWHTIQQATREFTNQIRGD